MSLYFDHNASTPVADEVIEAMLPFIKGQAGNASSLHQQGRFLRSAIENARAEVAEFLGSEPQSVVFTSGGSESNNLAIKGFLDSSRDKVLTSPVEHASVLQPIAQLTGRGHDCQFLSVDNNGVIETGAAEKLVQHTSPRLVSVQWANNETGAIQPLDQLVEIVRSKNRDCLVHSDAVQAVGKIAVDFNASKLDLMSVSAHKLNGPKGVGALLVKPGLASSEPLISGGGQELSFRAGTENVAGIVGFGAACKLAAIDHAERYCKVHQIREYFERALKQIPGVIIYSESVERLPNTSFFSIPWYHGETLLMELDRQGMALASGSACHSQVTEPSHVLQAMGVDDEQALNAVRVSFGLNNTMNQVDELIRAINQLIERLPASLRRAVG